MLLPSVKFFGEGTSDICLVNGTVLDILLARLLVPHSLRENFLMALSGGLFFLSEKEVCS
jgi:hypothetical protein